MLTADALLDLHERAHRNLEALLVHCREFSGEDIDRELPGFGYPSVRLQLHHGIGAEKYWIGAAKQIVEPTRKEIVNSTRFYLAIKDLMIESGARAIVRGNSAAAAVTVRTESGLIWLVPRGTDP